MNGGMCRKTEEREGNGKTTGERRAYTVHLWTLRPWNQLVGEKSLVVLMELNQADKLGRTTSFTCNMSFCFRVV